MEKISFFNLSWHQFELLTPTPLPPPPMLRAEDAATLFIASSNILFSVLSDLPCLQIWYHLDFCFLTLKILLARFLNICISVQLDVLDHQISYCTVSPPHTDLHVANFHRCRYVPSTSGMNVIMPFPSYCWRSFSSTIPHLFSLLQSITPLACSFTAAPTCRLLDCTTALFKVCTIRLEMFPLFFVFVFYAKSIINLVLYSTR